MASLHSSPPARSSPVGKRVSLFVTCIADAIYPQTGQSVVRLLDYIDVNVEFPSGQTCCGQPAFNSGYWSEARTVARQFLKAFRDADVIVAPSGSCAAMVRCEYPKLFAGDPWRSLAEEIAGKTWEFTEYLVDGLGMSDLGLRLPEPRSFALARFLSWATAAGSRPCGAYPAGTRRERQSVRPGRT